ncbi:MAG: LysR family transcriptional regulator [Xenophilus sp.]
MDRLKAMQTFVQIAEQGSLTRAAGALGHSLPAVVRSLAALESHLGVRLFQRTTRRLALTDEGRRYLERAREVLFLADAADRAITDEAREPAGHLTLTAPVLFGHMHVAPVLVGFMQRHPRIHCDMLLNDRNVDLLEEGIDAGVRIGRLEDSTLVAQQLCSIRRVVVASPDFLRAHGTPRHPRELSRLPIVRGRIDAPAQWGFQEQGRPLSVPVSGRLAFSQLAPAIEACAAGMGFGIFFSYQVAHFVAQGRLVMLLEAFEPPPRPVSVVYPHARLLPARTRAFVDWMKQAFQSWPPS